MLMTWLLYPNPTNCLNLMKWLLDINFTNNKILNISNGWTKTKEYLFLR